MIIHHSKVEEINGKYYFKKKPNEEFSVLVTARVLFFSNEGNLECDFNFKDGVFDGTQKLYKDANYQLSSIENYKNGILHGDSKFYIDGILQNEITYRNGLALN